MTILKRNAFDIPDADQCLCRIWDYTIHHPTLTIKVTPPKPQKEFFIVLHLPIYFEGPMLWQGAGFNVVEPRKYPFLRETMKHYGKDYQIYEISFVSKGVIPSVYKAFLSVWPFPKPRYHGVIILARGGLVVHDDSSETL